MLPVRMIHTKYGATHAYDNGEVEKLQKLGWEVEGASKPEGITPDVLAYVGASPENVVEIKRKPGRPRKT